LCRTIRASRLRLVRRLGELHQRTRVRRRGESGYASGGSDRRTDHLIGKGILRFHAVYWRVPRVCRQRLREDPGPPYLTSAAPSSPSRQETSSTRVRLSTPTGPTRFAGGSRVRSAIADTDSPSPPRCRANEDLANGLAILSIESSASSTAARREVPPGEIETTLSCASSKRGWEGNRRLRLRAHECVRRRAILNREIEAPDLGP